MNALEIAKSSQLHRPKVCLVCLVVLQLWRIRGGTKFTTISCRATLRINSQPHFSHAMGLEGVIEDAMMILVRLQNFRFITPHLSIEITEHQIQVHNRNPSYRELNCANVHYYFKG